tara:strand:- start:7208 stop:8536 length:1329 start_codon:yes stop_codon:yes gene_type:complete
MHQDKKVGLALALLVLGFVGAFCLRQDRNTTVEIPELNDPHYLDEQIADKDRTPYLGSQESERPGSQLGSEQVLTGITDTQNLSSSSKVAVPTISHTSPASQSTKKGSNAERWGEMPEFLKEIELPQEQFSSPKLKDSVFEPNQNQPEVKPISQGATPSSSGSEIIKPQHNNAWEVNPPQQKPETTGPEQRQPPQIRIHTVKAGETLSEISIRYLGTSRKYQEIFNLNRDQLRSPNDIRAGMKLRIPVDPSPQTKPQSANSQTSLGASANSGKRTIGQMVSQPTLKSGSSTVQFEGLIESLSTARDQKTVPAPESGNLPDQKIGIKSIPESYRKFIPVPRSPLTPRAASQSSAQGTKPGQSLSQVQPENVDQILDDLFDKNSEAAKPSGNSKSYTIKEGDTLESIAVRIYGKPSAAFEIYQKNRDLLKSANYIRPGMVLQLP